MLLDDIRHFICIISFSPHKSLRSYAFVYSIFQICKQRLRFGPSSVPSISIEPVTILPPTLGVDEAEGERVTWSFPAWEILLGKEVTLAAGHGSPGMAITQPLHVCIWSSEKDLGWTHRIKHSQ